MDDYLIVKNPDKELRARIKERVKANDGYCPCRFEKTVDTKCPCKDFRENGDCICGFFIKVPCVEVSCEDMKGS